MSDERIGIDHLFHTTTLERAMTIFASQPVLEPVAETAGYFPPKPPVVWVTPNDYSESQFGNVQIRFPCDRLLTGPLRCLRRAGSEVFVVGTELGKALDGTESFAEVAGAWSRIADRFVRVAIPHPIDLTLADQVIGVQPRRGGDAALETTMKLVAFASLRPAPMLASKLPRDWIWPAYEMLAKRLERASAGPPQRIPQAGASLASFLAAVVADDFARAGALADRLWPTPTRDALGAAYAATWGREFIFGEDEPGAAPSAG
ncbi:MAG: hypothetical protein ACOZNI_05620 [Myxococcota bacterium]